MSETKSLLDERRTLHVVSPSHIASDTVKAPEPFVSAEEAARFLSVKRRQLLAMARRGLVWGVSTRNGDRKEGVGIQAFRNCRRHRAASDSPENAKNAIRFDQAVPAEETFSWLISADR